jgi:16S rRNA (guanine966-N2)-methyltransferase
VRVVAGTARGRRLVTPEGRDTRPTTDRVREAVFNVLFSLGGVVDAVVLDCFAGSGALGIEALSRGAAEATFIDNARAATAAITANLETLGLADRATVLGRPVESTLAGTADRFDLVFADPPYGFDAWPDLLDTLAALVTDDALVVCESSDEVALPPSWERVRHKSYGSTVITIARRTATDTQE